MTATGFDEERHELQAVLDSGIFNRAPNLANVLTYVCTKFFEGSAEQIKEYNIAVDALGRPAAFDQKRDSIVRVEAHRLRKRLREYYEAEGAGHAVRIEIPSGQYAPRFLFQGTQERDLSPALVQELAPSAEVAPASVANATGSDSLEVATILRPDTLVAAPAPVRWGRRGSIPIGIVLLAACLAAVVFLHNPLSKRAKIEGPALAASIPTLPPAASDTREIRILAGRQRSPYIDRLGRAWESDRYFQGGSVYESGDHPIYGTRDPKLYQSRREGSFGYDIPLAPGVYELRLHFAETLYGENNVAGGGETSRLFNVSINGTPALQQFDVIADVGSSAADIRAFKDISPAADGKLHLRFEPSSNPAFLNAIEITPGTPGKLQPIRMGSRDHAFTDKQGRTWEPDRYSRGGQLVLRTSSVANASDPELYRGERYGNLRYVIPAPPGRYTVTLYFAEAWFGPGTPAGGGAGSRVFDILCNGLALRRGFDIFKEAHGGERAFVFTAHGLEPDAQGQLTISLAPVRNYASVNAVEVLDEAK